MVDLGVLEVYPRLDIKSPHPRKYIHKRRELYILRSWIYIYIYGWVPVRASRQLLMTRKRAVPGPHLGLSDQLTSRQPYFDFEAPSPRQHGCPF